MRKKNSPQYHFQKHPNTRGPQLHMVIPLQIMKFTLTLKRREICCVDKMGRKRKIGKSRKEKEVRTQKIKEKGAAIWELKRIEICCDIGKGKRWQKITLYFVLWEMKKKKRLESREKRLKRTGRHFGKRREICNDKRNKHREKRNQKLSLYFVQWQP